MVYSAIETTCFGLYWPSSGFYNIEEESIWVYMIQRSPNQQPHTVFTAYTNSSSIIVET